MNIKPGAKFEDVGLLSVFSFGDRGCQVFASFLPAIPVNFMVMKSLNVACTTWMMDHRNLMNKFQLYLFFFLLVLDA